MPGLLGLKLAYKDSRVNSQKMSKMPVPTKFQSGVASKILSGICPFVPVVEKYSNKAANFRIDRLRHGRSEGHPLHHGLGIPIKSYTHVLQFPYDKGA